MVRMFAAVEFVRVLDAMFVRTLTALVSVENGGLYASV